MKKIFLALIFISGSVFGQAPFPEGVYFTALNTSITNLAGASTNTTVGVASVFPDAHNGCAIFLSATTYTNVGSIVVYIQGSPDGVLYDTSLNSAIKLTLNLTNSVSASVATTNTISSWFNIVGLTRIRTGRIEVNSPTVVTNLNIKFSYPLKYDSIGQ